MTTQTTTPAPAPVQTKAPAAPSAAAPLKMKVGTSEQVFDIESPDMPEWVEKQALRSGGYPYKKKLDSKEYEQTIERLQIELVKLLVWMQANGKRVLVVFEGRDAAGKGGTIETLREYMNPRTARNVALTKPTETERGQWYYQRYVAHFPTSGEFVTFDRSWYNRAGVEPVMGFCTPEQHQHFLEETPRFEKQIVREGIIFFKFWLDIGQEMQLKRFHDRRHSPLTAWKFSPMDVAGMSKWEDYGRMRDLMIEKTHAPHAPWTVVRSNDKRRARIEVMRHILSTIPYQGRNEQAIGEADPKIVGAGMSLIRGA